MLLRDAGEDAKPIAGGQSLVPLLAYRLTRPSHIVDIDGLEGLDRIETHADGSVELGALVRHATLERAVLAPPHSLLAEAAAHVGHVPIRVRGTLGGSVAHADPAAELPTALVALGADVLIRSAAGARTVAVVDFFVAPFATTLEPGELVTAVRLPALAGAWRTAFAEFAVRSGDFALASAGVALDLDGARIASARIALGGVGGTPLRAEAAERALAGGELCEEVLAEAAALAARDCDPSDDRTASARYRRELVRHLVAECLRSAAGGTA